MKAIVWTKYGAPNGLQLQELERPIPADNEVLIRVHATTVTTGDCELRSLKLPLLIALPMRIYVEVRRPERKKVLGQELSGVVKSIGKDVSRFREGDEVFGITSFAAGSNAEYICLPEAPREMEGALAIKPSNMTFEEAAAVPGRRCTF